MASNTFEEEATKHLMKRLKSKWCELRYDEIRNKSYLIGKKNEPEEMQALYSIDARKTMDFKGLKEVITDSEQSSVVLAIHSSDSTCLFYKCQMGLKSPLSLKVESSESSDESSKN